MTDDDAPEEPADAQRSRVSRRNFLGAAGGLVAGAALVGARDQLTSHKAATVRNTDSDSVEPFYGLHQGGITTRPQSHTYFAALDVTTDRRSELAALLQSWTAVAANLTSGRTAAPLVTDVAAVEPDSGEAVGLGPARLTTNFGFGPGLFGRGAPDRFGLAKDWPVWLIDLPAFPGDELIESKTGGDLTIHACADDPQVAFHAVRQLVRAADGVATIRWSQAGFNEASASTGTPRNLMGFKDGTINPRTGAELDRFVWVGHEGPDWLTGGTYLVVRRVRISFNQWDAEPLGSQERVIGRHKVSGAPLGKSNEFDELDLEAAYANGNLVIPYDSHVRLASPQENWGEMMLRRSYAYNDGVDPLVERRPPGGLAATLDAGLFFAAYQRNPRLVFIPIFQRMAELDALREFTTHTGSAVVAIPPAAARPGHWVGQQLFE
jgi:deferrochelatase/peroxidase EfeB